MISTYTIKELGSTLQTTELNVRREYIQHLFLSYFYRIPEAQHIYFKGGTALRIVFQSPRFSEDLDFSAQLIDTRAIEDTIIKTLRDIEREGISTEIIESKKTSGGYLTHIECTFDDQVTTALLQFSERTSTDRGEVVTISSKFVPPFSIMLLSRKQLTDEKIQALLTRAKPRDFYDLYFMIRSNLIDPTQKNFLRDAYKKLEQTPINFELELKQFLPKSHWPIIKDFTNNLRREIQRYL